MDEKDIIVMSNHDKPVKIVFEDKIKSSKTEKYHKTLSEVLKELLWNSSVRNNLTRQQIHTERGKIRRGYYDQSINFFVKRGITKNYIDEEINMERERTMIEISCSFNKYCLSGNYEFGIFNLSD